ncbi:MAG: ParB/RepB/Spo0J family partition protein, partial [Oscillospiraceae bacterium]
IGTDGGDFSACYVYSLDLVFVKRVLNYVNSLEGAEKHDHAIPEEWRAADFGQCYRSSDCYGLCTFHLYFQNNKTGTEARRDVMRRFFDDYGYGRGIRKDMTKDKEKEIIRQRIEIAKENARAKHGIPEIKKEVTKMKFDIGSMINAPTSENGALTVKDIPIDMLVPYHDHPFVLYSGERLDDMVNSVKTNGILTPIITRTLPDGKYEILAGHNRTNAAKLAGLTTVPAVVKENLSDEEAEMYLIETNVLQRGFKELRISEQAAVVALRHSKMFDEKKQKAISDELLALEGEGGSKQSKLAAVGEEYNLSKNTIARLIRVHKLLEACEKYTESADTGNLSIRAAVELSYIPASALEIIFERYNENIMINNVWRNGVKIDVRLAEQLRELFKSFDGGKRAAELILDTMQKCEDMPKKKKPVKLDPDVRTKYFSDDESDDYVNSVIAKALEMYFENNDEAQNKL